MAATAKELSPPPPVTANPALGATLVKDAFEATTDAFITAGADLEAAKGADLVAVHFACTHLLIANTAAQLLPECWRWKKPATGPGDGESADVAVVVGDDVVIMREFEFTAA